MDLVYLPPIVGCRGDFSENNITQSTAMKIMKIWLVKNFEVRLVQQQPMRVNCDT